MERNIEYFGPWARTFKYPYQIATPLFEPYPNAEIVFDTALKSVNKAKEVLYQLSEIMPDLTGFSPKKNRFWEILYGHLVVVMCGKIQDMIQRYESLPQDDYVLGTPNNLSAICKPQTWDQSKILVNREFIPHITSDFLSRKFNNTESIDYIYEEVDFPADETKPNYRSILQASIAQLNNYSRFFHKRSLVSKLVPGARNHEKIKSLIWDTEYLFKGIKQDVFVCKDEIIMNSNSVDFGEINIDEDKRNELCNKISFPYGFALANTIPASAFEGLRQVVSNIDLSFLNKYKNLKRIYTHSQILVSDDYDRVAACLLVDQGIQIVSMTHGGYGYYSHPIVFLEGDLNDEFISWGFKRWGYSTDSEKESLALKNPKPFPSLKLSKLKYGNHTVKRDSRQHKSWETVLLLLTESKKIKWLYNPLLPDMAHDYYSRQKVLLDFFGCRPRTLAKLYPKEFGWNQRLWIENEYPQVTIEYKKKNFIDHAQNAEISIIDYNSTGFNQVIVLELPFVCTWNRRWFRGDDLFEECLQELEKVGIYYDHPSKLINAYTKEISSDIESWWRDSSRIEAVRLLAKNFALTSPNYQSEWYNELSR